MLILNMHKTNFQSLVLWLYHISFILQAEGSNLLAFKEKMILLSLCPFKTSLITDLRKILPLFAFKSY